MCAAVAILATGCFTPHDGACPTTCTSDGTTCACATPLVTASFDNAGGEVLRDFPVPLLLEGPAVTTPDDLVILDDDGTLLPFDVDTWRAGERAIVWVVVPEIEATTLDHVTVASATASAGGAPPWVDYAGVWHMTPEADGSVLDASGGGLTGTSETPATVADGVLGAALGCGELAAPLKLEGSEPLLRGWSTYTLELWIRPEYTSDAAWDTSGELRFMDKIDGAFVDGRLRRTDNLEPGVGLLQLDLHFDGVVDYPVVGVRNGEWNYVAFSYDGDTQRVFVDGATEYEESLGEPGMTSVPSGALVLCPRTAFPGRLDEVRISTVARSPAWIAAQHRAVGGTFVSYAPAP